MSKVQLFSQDERTRSKTITLPLVGDQLFDSETNSISVDAEKADALLELDFGISLVKKSEEGSTSNDPNRTMLEALEMDEVNDLLSTYPQKITKGLKTKQEKIDYLLKEMAK